MIIVHTTDRPSGVTKPWAIPFCLAWMPERFEHQMNLTDSIWIVPGSVFPDAE